MPAVELEQAPATPLDDALRRLGACVSPYTGIVRNVVEFLHAPDETRLFTVGCSLADADEVTGEATVDRAGGAHYNRDAARAAAIGEAIERYSTSYVPEPDLVVATAEQIGPTAVDPDRFALFHEQQYAAPGFPFQQFRPDTRVAWAPGWSLSDGGPAFLPAQLVYLRRPAEGEPLLGFPTSNGVACAPSVDEAVLSGLCELVERDAFMIAWYNRLSLPRLVWERNPELVTLDRRYFGQTGLSYSAVDLSAFMEVPVVLGVVRGSPGEPGPLGIGAGCAPTVEVAWRKALGEAFAVRRWSRDMSTSEPGRRLERRRDIQTFEDHIRYYGDEERARHADFLVASSRTRDVADVAPLEGATVRERIEAIVRRLARRGVSAYAVEVSAPDVREAGLAVVHVVAPELCALDVVDTARYLGGTRLYRAAYDGGLVPKPLTPADLNPYPHPFP